MKRTFAVIQAVSFLLPSAGYSAIPKSSPTDLALAKKILLDVKYENNLPTPSNTPKWIEKLIYIYISTDRWTFKNDPSIEKEYLANYRDKKYVKYMLLKILKQKYTDNLEYYNALASGRCPIEIYPPELVSRALREYDKKSQEEREKDIAEAKKAVEGTQHRINLVEAW